MERNRIALEQFENQNRLNLIKVFIVIFPISLINFQKIFVEKKKTLFYYFYFDILSILCNCTNLVQIHFHLRSENLFNNLPLLEDND